MFYWNILQKDEGELVRKVLDAQQLNPVKNDICLKFEEDLRFCDIEKSISEIANMKKSIFKKLVNAQLRVKCRDSLLTLKATHSKLSQLDNSYKLQGYLSTRNLNVEQKQILFRFRTRMISVKSNFKSQHGQNLTCQFCNEEDQQSHLLFCSEITQGIDTSQVKYEHIFGSTSEQEKVAIILTKIIKQRNTKLKSLSQ